jgi:tripartite-type tricarboxylate transporter receptor subunit TctC
LVVPFPPGGTTTVMARNVADKMSAALGQSIVVENRGGAGGTLGTRYAAKATPETATQSCSAIPARSRSRPRPMAIRATIRARISRRSA